MAASQIVHLRIALDEVKPAVTRRVEVPLTIHLDRLHLVLQAAMGWTNSHLYEIRAQDAGWGMPNPDSDDGLRDASKARLADALKDARAKSLTYLYDFGDGWEHSLRIERIADAVPGIAYPRLVEAVGRCPPEDVGGPWGYADFLEALADPNHEEHADKLEWIGGHFDPTNAEAESLAEDVRRLARKWARKPSSRQPR
ncbi:MAG: plasmid pRiA4b ORF-3 family protein [Acetobacteraceae bacterium]